MTKRERELIYAEAMRHTALAELCFEADLRRHHEEVAAALLAALERNNSAKENEIDSKL